MRKLFILPAIFVILFSACQAPKEYDIVATTSWTAAFAYAAGADDVYVLAPPSMLHPPEYELTPADVRIISRARTIVYAGYETMAQKLSDITDDEHLLKIVTRNDSDAFRLSIMRLASKFETMEQAAEKVETLCGFYVNWREEIQAAGLREAPVVCQKFMEPIARELGFYNLLVLGPAPPEASQLKELSEFNSVLIIDNLHNPLSRSVSSITGNIPVAMFRNFPSDLDDDALLNVLKDNKAKFDAAVIKLKIYKR